MHSDDLNVPWKYKFVLELSSGSLIECYSRNMEERSLWIQSFCRVIDFNRGISPEQSGQKSEEYAKLVARNQQRKEVKYNTAKKNQ